MRYIKAIIPRGVVVPLPEYIQNIHAMIDLCRQRNPDVKITIWSTCLVQDAPERNQHIARYNETLKKIAQEKSCAFCDSAVHVDANNPEHYLDNVHLSPTAITHLAHGISESF